MGFAGHQTHPARQNLRQVKLNINSQDWFMQYSPYGYYNEHFIVFNKQHIPMTINAQVFNKLFDFVEQFPHYFIGSNADLPIVGGSILTHEHFQGGNSNFAMAKAPIERTFLLKNYMNVSAGIVKWPMSVIRLSSKTGRLWQLHVLIFYQNGEHIRMKWLEFMQKQTEFCIIQLLQLQEQLLLDLNAIWY